MRLRNRHTMFPYSAEALNYNLANYPGVKLHWRCNETSGTDMVDEVRELTIRPTASIAFGSPAYTVHPEGNSNDTVYNGPYPTFDTTKFIISLAIGRCTDSASGRNSLGQQGPGPGIALSFVGGMHTRIQDDLGAVISVATDVTKSLTSGTDYILAVMVRPTGQNIEGSVYTTTGTLVHQQLVNNTGLSTITPVSLCRPVGIAFYQWITYQFAVEPPDLISGLIWHAAKSMAGVKAPYPSWRNRAAA